LRLKVETHVWRVETLNQTHTKTDQNTKEQRNSTFFLGIQENWGPGREIGQTQKHKRE
jgi:hypothetical protein